MFNSVETNTLKQMYIDLVESGATDLKTKIKSAQIVSELMTRGLAPVPDDNGGVMRFIAI